MTIISLPGLLACFFSGGGREIPIVSLRSEHELEHEHQALPILLAHLPVKVHSLDNVLLPDILAIKLIGLDLLISLHFINFDTDVFDPFLLDAGAMDDLIVEAQTAQQPMRVLVADDAHQLAVVGRSEREVYPVQDLFGGH